MEALLPTSNGMKRILLWGAFLFLSPALVLAAGLPATASAAGFAKSSLFLSKTSVTEGDSVLIYAPIQNSATGSFAGNVAFSEGNAAIGSVAISLKAGEARIVSVSWTPASPGAHAVTAELKNDDTTVEKQSATFTVSAKPVAAAAPVPHSESAAVAQSSAQVKDWLGNISPVIENTLAPVFNTIDPLRESASNFLDRQMAQTKPKLPGNILGIETESGSTTASGLGGLGATFWGILWTLYFYILTILNFLIVNAAIFYPVLAILFLFALWKLYQRMSGRSYRY